MLTIIRHAESCNNVNSKLNMRRDPGLSPWGVQSARQMGATLQLPVGLHFDANAAHAGPLPRPESVHVSCLLRTWMTAVCLFPWCKKLIIVPYIKETSIGGAFDIGNYPAGPEVQRIRFRRFCKRHGLIEPKVVYAHEEYTEHPIFSQLTLPDYARDYDDGLRELLLLLDRGIVVSHNNVMKQFYSNHVKPYVPGTTGAKFFNLWRMDVPVGVAQIINKLEVMSLERRVSKVFDRLSEFATLIKLHPGVESRVIENNAKTDCDEDVDEGGKTNFEQNVNKLLHVLFRGL